MLDMIENEIYHGLTTNIRKFGTPANGETDKMNFCLSPTEY